MSGSEVGSAQSAVYAAFRLAVLDFSEEPTPANLARYLEASRALDGRSKAPEGSRSRPKASA